jgi:RHS repeat-associated protein
MSIIKDELGKVIIPNEVVSDIYYPFGNITKLSGDTSTYEDELFFYHNSHVFSVEMVTDINANVTQQVLYNPFGQIISSYNPYWHQGKIPDYTFSVMEFDEENQMYYFHARYYNPPTFISRDPLFEKKITSPYAAFRNNPLLYIDPNGEDEYEFDKKGNHVRTIENKDADIVRIVNRRGKEVASKSYDYGIVQGITSDNTKRTTTLSIKDNASRKDIFEHLADNTKVEWMTINAHKGNEEKNYISTLLLVR